MILCTWSPVSNLLICWLLLDWQLEKICTISILNYTINYREKLNFRSFSSIVIFAEILLIFFFNARIILLLIRWKRFRVYREFLILPFRVNFLLFFSFATYPMVLKAKVKTVFLARLSTKYLLPMIANSSFF